MLSRAFLFFLFTFVVSWLAVDGNPPRKKWISELFLEGRASFAMNEMVSEPCRTDFDLYTLHLNNQTVWAVRMMESSEWPTVGLYAGVTKHLGNWGECLRVSTATFRGQYCLVRMKISFEQKRPLNSLRRMHQMTVEQKENSSAWDIIELMEEDPIRASRLEYMWAVCVPSSCTAKDLQTSLNASMSSIFRSYNLKSAIYVESEMCQTSETPHYSNGLRRTSYFFGAIMACVIVATGYDLLKRPSDNQLVEIFSVLRNYEKLRTDASPSVNRIFYLQRIISTIFTLFFHTVLIGIQHSTLETELVEEKYSPYYFATDFNVDLFFVMSGYLMFDNNLSATIKGGFRFIAIKVVFKHLRIMSTYTMYMLFWINILPYLNEGPFWKSEMLNEIEICKSYWWLNVLGIANLVAVDRLCLVISWFSTVLAQLTLIGAIMVFAFAVNRKYGISSILLTFAFGVLLTFTIVYQRKLNAIYLMLFRGARDLRLVRESSLYMGTYARIGPYALGFAGAVFTDALRKRNYKFSTIQTLAIVVATATVASKVVIYRNAFVTPGRPYSASENALYAAVQRCASVLPFVCAYCIYLTSAGAGLRWLMERRSVVIVGRLIEQVYYIHIIVLVYTFSSQKTYTSVSVALNYSITWAVISCAVISFAGAFFVHLLIDSPIKNMIHLVERKLYRKYLKSTNKIE